MSVSIRFKGLSGFCASLCAAEDDGWGLIDKTAAQGMVVFIASAKSIENSFPAAERYTTDLLKSINDFDFGAIREQAKKAL